VNYCLSAWLSNALDLMTVKPKTLASYESLSRLLVARLGDRPIADLSTLDVQRYVTTAGRELSASRVRQSYVVLQRSLAMAVTYGYLRANPCVSVSLPRLARREMRYLTASEVEALAASCEGYETLVRFLAYTGVRWGEACALRFGDIDGNRVYVRRTQVDIAGTLTCGTPKGNSERTVFLPSVLRLSSGRPDGLVFTTALGKPVRAANFRNRVWLPALQYIGKPDLRVHDLRHTAVALLIQAGVHPKVIQRLMGHSSVAITMDTYGHLIGNQLEQASHALDELLAGSDRIKMDDHTCG
jgi:integrase